MELNGQKNNMKRLQWTKPKGEWERSIHCEKVSASCWAVHYSKVMQRQTSKEPNFEQNTDLTLLSSCIAGSITNTHTKTYRSSPLRFTFKNRKVNEITFYSLVLFTFSAHEIGSGTRWSIETINEFRKHHFNLVIHFFLHFLESVQVVRIQISWMKCSSYSSEISQT